MCNVGGGNRALSKGGGAKRWEKGTEVKGAEK